MEQLSKLLYVTKNKKSPNLRSSVVLRGGSPPHQLPGKTGRYQAASPHPLVVLVTRRRGNRVAAHPGGGTVVQVLGAFARLNEDYSWKYLLNYEEIN